MNTSLRAKSEMNYLQNSSQLRLLRKYTFDVFSSHDHQHMTCFITLRTEEGFVRRMTLKVYVSVYFNILT
jgi:hypothetical protein